MTQVPQNILDEINKHDLNSFRSLGIDHAGVTGAIAFLLNNDMSEMAQHLRQMTLAGFIRQGPLDGFVAAAVSMPAGEYILLSTLYTEYNTAAEIMASLVMEAGCLKAFNRSPEENELRSLKALTWFSQQKPAAAPVSFIASAAQKTERKVKGSLIDILLAEKKITEEQLRDARDRQLGAKKPLHDVLIEMGFISEDDLAIVFSKAFDMPITEIRDEDVDRSIASLLTFDQMRQYSAFAFKKENGRIIVAMSNPRDLAALEDLSAILDVPVRSVLVSRKEIMKRLESVDVNDEAVNGLLNNSLAANIQAVGVDTAAPSLPGLNADMIIKRDEAKELLTDMERKEKQLPAFPNMPIEFQSLLQEETPTVKLVNLIVYDAIKAKASDIHIEPRETSIEIRYRIDGDLKNILQIPMKFHPKIVARIKILASLDITQNMMPQDGRIQLAVDGRKVDFRVSTIPTFYGEKVVIRILDSVAAKTNLDLLGFNQSEKESFMEAVKNPQGMVLVTGPTGSGKTSTLYAALNYVKNETTNVVTIEDPIEFLNEEINQIQVNPARGVTFASGLRSILRQDPNVILLGEIRDKETADIALKASITGHLLLSTLHTNSCAATITRLADIGIDYYQISSALIMIVSQRLVKRICVDCITGYTPDEEYLKRFKDEIEEFKLTKFFKGKGCPKCNYSGYKGRVAVFEVMKISEGLKNIIAKGASEEEMLKEARKNGFKTLIQAGMDKVKEEITTLDEVVKHLGNVDRSIQASIEPSAEKDAPTTVRDPNRRKKILVVDDEDDIRKIVSKYLQVAGYDVVGAVNGQNAVELAFKEKPDLIITDVMMPVMDGIEATKVLRSKVETAVIPIIMLTAKQDKESELTGLNVGADDYITKPFDKEKLLARVSMLLRRGSLNNG